MYFGYYDFFEGFFWEFSYIIKIIKMLNVNCLCVIVII